jgi:2',3'-cyclic-nucleotide 2'-phosphodiesterase / 3'-nucleotidase / 5'-nucleotidase
MSTRKLKPWMAWALTLIMCFSLFSPMVVRAEDANTVSIQVLATSDLHGRFMPWEYATDTENLNGSLAQIATIVKKTREANPNTILVDNGDTIQDNSSQLFLNDEIHPMILAMNEIGYDTYTLGNHEFNYGIPALEKVIAPSKAKILAGNLYRPDGTRFAAPYTIIEKAGVKVGIIGMTNPNITKWDAANLVGYTVTSPIEETKKAIQELQGQVDVMIGVIHVGPTEEYGNDDGADVIAQACPELAAIVAGHAHTKVIETRVNNVVITEPNRYGDNVAQISLTLTKNPEGKYTLANRATDIKASLIPVNSSVIPDPDLVAKLQPYDDRAKADARTVIGELRSQDLVPEDEVKGIPSSQIEDTPMIDLINEVQMYYSGANVSAAAAFSTTANILKGPITKAGVSQIYKYDNTLYLLEVTGKQLKQYMEWSASYYNTFKEGDLTLSFNEKIRGYNYDMFSGVKYQVDISKEPGSRIFNLTRMDGTPISDSDILKLAVNNYRANSQLLLTGPVFKAGEALPKLLEKDIEGRLGGVRELIGKYIQEVKGGVIHPDLDNNWNIIGYNWDTKERNIAVRLINEGALKLPTSADGRTPNVRSITWMDVLQAPAKTIDILSFNDFHGSMKQDGKNIGAAYLAGEIKKAQKANPDTLVVSAGDIYQGSSMSNLTYGEPVSEFLHSINLEASALGNHEFDWGIDKIETWAKEGKFDFLAANIYDKTTGKTVSWAKPYKVIKVGGKRIAFIGLSTPETLYKTKPEIVKDLEFRDPAESANYWAEYLKANDQADYIIALTHLGAFQDSKSKEITGEAAELAKNSTGIDAIVSGHTHTTVSGKVNGIPIVQAYYNGRSLAKLAIGFNIDGEFLGIVPSVSSDLYKKTDLVEDPAVKAIYEKWNKELAPILEEVLGTTDKELTHSKDQGTSLLGEWVCDVMKEKAGTQISITNGGGIRTSIPAGDITMGKMYEVMPFDNTLVKMELKGSDLKRVLENGILNSNIGWVQVSGVKVYYDPAATVGKRITSMRLLDGTLVNNETYYSVVTNDFMFTGGDGYNFSGNRNAVDTGIPIRDALVEKIRAVQNLSVQYVDYLIEGADPGTQLPNAA